MIIGEWSDNENDKIAILNLTRKNFGDVEYSKSSYFDWQYRNNPQGKAIVIIARDEEKNREIIGLTTLIPMKLIIDNQKIIASSLSCNVQVDPEYRNQGVFSKLMKDMPNKALERGITSLYAVPNEQSYRSFIKHGYVEVINLTLLARPLRLSKYFDGILKSIIRPFESIWKIRKKSISDVKQFTNKFDEEFEQLVAKASRRVSIIQNRDKGFLEWRYSNHPTRKYRVFVLREDSFLKGYVVTRRTDINGKEIGVIVDFLVDEEAKNPRGFQDLITVSLEDLWQDGVSLAIATSRQGLLEHNILRKSGFLRIPDFLKPNRLPLVVISYDKKDNTLAKLTTFDNWFFSFGDYDIF